MFSTTIHQEEGALGACSPPELGGIWVTDCWERSEKTSNIVKTPALDFSASLVWSPRAELVRSRRSPAPSASVEGGGREELGQCGSPANDADEINSVLWLRARCPTRQEPGAHAC